MSVTSKALWYIESHLDSELTLDVVAEMAGVSRFHLSRAFAASTNSSLAAYMRARRLSGAAKALALGAPDILALALSAGYGSHEAFTRAFRQQFGLTPEQVRARGDVSSLSLQEPIQMNHQTQVALAQPRLETCGTLLIFGLSRRCERAGDPGIPAQWNSFVPHLGSIRGQKSNTTYGVIYNSDESANYDYLCGVEVSEFPSEPAEFTRLRIPSRRYAVFEHREHVAAVANTWRGIWEHGLADAGLEASDGPAFERYGEGFDGRTGLGGFEIWVPVR